MALSLLFLLFLLTFEIIGHTNHVFAFSPKMPAKKPTTLERSIFGSSSHQQQQQQANKDVILLVDANNVRGKTKIKFQWTMAELLQNLQEWRRQLMSLQAKDKGEDGKFEIICVIDHACQTQALDYCCNSTRSSSVSGISEDRLLVVFAGPHQTADDVIAEAAQWLTTPTAATNSIRFNTTNNNFPPNVFVVTSDRELRHRCLRTNRPGNYKRKQKQRNNVKAFDSASLVQSILLRQQDKNHDDGIHNEHHLSTVFERKVRNYHHPSTAAPAILCDDFDEKTWHRILFAEYLRRCLEEESSRTIIRDTSSSTITAANGLLQSYRQLFRRDMTTTATNHLQENNKLYPSMFSDHRIEHEPDQQLQLLNFLEYAITNDTNSNHDNTHHHNNNKKLLLLEEENDERVVERGQDAETQWIAQEFGT